MVEYSAQPPMQQQEVPYHEQQMHLGSQHQVSMPQMSDPSVDIAYESQMQMPRHHAAAPLQQSGPMLTHSVFNGYHPHSSPDAYPSHEPQGSYACPPPCQQQ